MASELPASYQVDSQSSCLETLNQLYQKQGVLSDAKLKALLSFFFNHLLTSIPEAHFPEKYQNP